MSSAPTTAAEYANAMLREAQGAAGIYSSEANSTKLGEVILDSDKVAEKAEIRGSRRGKRTNKRRTRKKKAQQNTALDGSDHDCASELVSDAKNGAATLDSSTKQPQQEPSSRPPKNIATESQAVPVLPHYELRAISVCSDPQMTGDKSSDTTVFDNEYGLFATQSIKEGTRIIYEQPLLTLPSPGNQIKELRAAFDKLSEKQKARVWSLKPSEEEASDQLQFLGGAIEPVLMEMTPILNKLEEDRTEEDWLELKSSGPKLDKAVETVRLFARWHANQCSLVDLPAAERKNLPSEQPITGLFVETAHLRHSCVPNCYAAYSPATNHMSVHVTGQIQAGEELTLSSIADTMCYETADERKVRLFDNYRIQCKCEACDASHPNFKMHEEARLCAHGRAVMLMDFCTRLEMMDFDQVLQDLHLPKNARPGQEPTLQELKDAEEMILALCNNLKTTQCVTVEQIRWRNAIIDRIQPKIAAAQTGPERLRTWQAMAGHAKACEVIGLRCFGEDHENVKQLRARKEKIMAALQQIQKQK